MSNEQTLFNPDDPRLTAYALGELTDAAERAQVEEFLAASPEARAELADIRALTAALTAEYEQERAAATAEDTTPANVIPLPRSFWRRHQLGAIAALLALGGLAAFLAFPALLKTKAPRLVTFLSEPTPAVAAAAALAQPAPAATPSGQLLAQTAAPLPPSPPEDAEVRELVVPMDAPLPTNLPPGTKAVHGPSAVSGMVGGNPAASDGKDAHPLLLAKNRNQMDFALPVQSPDAAAPERVTVTGSNIPAAEAVAAPKPAKSQNASALGGKAPSAATLPVAAVPRLAMAARQRTAGIADDIQDQRYSGIAGFGDEHTRAVMVAAQPAAPAQAAPLQRAASTEAAILGTDIRSEQSKSTVIDGSVTGFLVEPSDRSASTADYVHTVENPFLGAKENPLSTFSADVDTASYAIVRRFIEGGSLPPKDAVRVEEMINYFPYTDAPPAPDSDKPFAIHLEAAACPWNTGHRLVRIGIKGKEMATDKRPPSNLVFLLDVSGSMSPEERLPLIKRSLRLMVDKLREDDHVAIVVYAGDSGLALPPTGGDHKEVILRSLENLHAGGSTNGASGIKLAYNVARKGFIKGGTNRVILATDGDFNVGVTDRHDLLRLIENQRKDGVFLSVLGVGTDNLKDSTMQTLADHGNGNYNYIDRLEEGRKVLVNQMSGTLVTIAKDVKIQVEFNPAAVASYRLIGYEKRMLRKEDFNNDQIDAGEIGAGHSVTALYEVVLAGQPMPVAAPTVDALKYQAAPAPVTAAPPEEDESRRRPRPPAAELLTVKMRHKAPDSDKSERSYEEALVDNGAAGEYLNASPDFQFAAAVASFGMVLRDSPHKGEATLGSALELAQAGKGEDAGGYRAGFIELLRQTRDLRSGER